MSFQDAVRICLQQKYGDFNGRARRSEFWFFVLFYVIVGVVGSVLDTIFHTRPSGMMYGGTGVIQGLLQLALIVPGLAVGARRLHDTNHSGWWQLLWLTFVGGIVLIVWWIQDSQPDNKYGPSPKDLSQGYGGYSEMPPAAPPTTPRR
jgi:uncharacterized membrane protein YhaH (DUF805 family)